MRFVSVRELRSHTSQLWRDLAEERDLVVTSHGKPVAILSATTEESLERSLAEIRRQRARGAPRHSTGGRTARSRPDVDGTDRRGNQDSSCAPKRAVRIVLDTNALVSGFLSPHGPPGAILRSVLAGSISVCFDERILAEYPRRPVARQFRL